MFTTKNERSKACPTSAVNPSATTIDTIASTTGTTEATTAPKTSRSTTSARADAEELARLQILVGGVAEVRIGGVAAGDVRLEVRAALARDRLDEPVDVLVGRVREHDRHDRRVAVRRDERLVTGLVVRLDGLRPERRNAREEPLDRAPEGRIVDREPVAADDEDLVDRVGLLGRGHSLVHEQARRLRFGRPGEVVFGCQRVAQERRRSARPRRSASTASDRSCATGAPRSSSPDFSSTATYASDYLPLVPLGASSDAAPESGSPPARKPPCVPLRLFEVVLAVPAGA